MMPARCFADKLFCHQPPLFGAGRQRFGIRRTELFVCLFVLFVFVSPFRDVACDYYSHTAEQQYRAVCTPF